MQWTDEQRRAIEEKGTNILLSAAAGSGKTTVLVARVLDLIINAGARIDGMLIVTFTRAASADMRRKLSQELSRRASEGDIRCREQLLLLERASITTLHGFCADFLRSYFESADVDPAFRVLDDAENRRLADEALSEAMEEAYEAMDAALSALDYGRGPKIVKSMAEKLMNVLEERPDPEKWLDEVCNADESRIGPWLDEMVYAAKADIGHALLYTRQAMAHPECSDTYFRSLEADAQALAAMLDIKGYENLRNAVCAWKQAAARTKKGENPPGDEVVQLRKSAKAAVEKAAIREIDMETALGDIAKLMPEIRRLGDIALRARELLLLRKDEISALSYSDLEHRTLAALQNPDTARMLRDRYEYVFVDEYQDTSDLQEALVNKIARGNNLFMVGDVKQSIYRFRQAEPRLFLDKYERYGRNDGGLLLPLTMNFRSRPAILNFVNRVFECAMTGGDSEITYDEYARLNHGNGALQGGRVEIHRLQNPDADTADEAALEMKSCERQAEFISRRIREMMGENPDLRYRDFAVLARNKRGVLSKMAAVFTKNGIPAFADGGEDFYESVEILLAVNLLKITANRRSDVETIGVLRSPVAGFTNDDLSRIRIFAPDCPYIDACVAYAGFENDEIARKLKNFFGMVEKWRLMAKCVNLGELARIIFDESGLYDACGALPGGRQRQANLDLLVSNAAAFDQNVSSSLTRFLAHVKKMRARGDGDDAHILGESDDVVRLMTAHKSKGLEFPVVFGAMMERRYSRRQSGENINAHRDLGLGAKYCDPEIQTRRKTLPQQAIIQRVRREDRAEELRILYVLLTRARDQLVLVGCERDLERADMRYRALKYAPNSAESYFDVIMPALMDDEGGTADIFCHTEVFGAAEMPAETRISLLETEPAAEDDALLRELMWVYPERDAASQPLKLTVSGLLREIQQPDRVEEMIERPAFLSEKLSQMTSSERGTAYHRALQFMDIGAFRGLSGRALQAKIQTQLSRMREANRLSEAQYRAVRAANLAAFYEGEIGRRMVSSQRIEREWPFNVMMKVSEALNAEEAGRYSDEELMVQGAIDCCFEEGGEWVLLDYKTSRELDGEALTERYFSQLRMYALALRRITGMKVKEIDLCLLLSGDHVRVDVE